MIVGEWEREGIVWGLLLLTAVLVLVFLIAAGVAYWAGASDLAILCGVGALGSVVFLPLYAIVVHLERVEREKKVEEKVDMEKLMLPLIIAGFLGVIALYAGLLMTGVSIEPELVAIALVGLTAIGVLWVIMKTPEDMKDLKKTLQELSEKVDRLSRLLEE